MTHEESIWIDDCICCRLAGLVRDLRVVSDSEGLVLKGRTQTYYAKQLVQHYVMKATGLPIRANDIEVV